MPEPQILTVVKDIVTIVGIVMAGGWAAWRWLFGEKLRRRREMAAPDGGLSVVEIPGSTPLTIVTVEATWRNRGPVPIVLCREHTRTEVFELRSELAIGPINFYDAERASLFVSIEPWWKTYIMEPLTDSLMQEHIALRRGVVYAFRHVLCLAPGSLPYKGTDAHFECMRDHIFAVSPLAAASDTKIGAEPPPLLSTSTKDVISVGLHGRTTDSVSTTA